MSRTSALRLVLVCSLIATIATLFTGCSRDPNVRKQKYFESGTRYFDKGKYREAAIQYSNALQVDSRFAQAHYQLRETYLKLHDWNRAFQELSRSVELAPDNYPAQADLANLLISTRNWQQAHPHPDVLRNKQPHDPQTFLPLPTYYS